MSATNSNAQSAAQSIDAHNLSFAPKPPTFTSKAEEREWLKFRLAQAFRIFGHLGYNEGVAGHITVRDPIQPDCFWVNPFGLHFSLIQPSDLLLVDVGPTGTYNSDSQAAILQNHGLLVATNTIEATVFFYIALERACQAQLLADAAAGGRGGRPLRIPDEEALKTSKTNGNMTAGWFQGLPEFQFLEAREGVTFAFNKGKDAKGDLKPSN
ncbi:hypothetical protein EST38_g1743 [Candolleomyces aberdarensis]|uniref:Class II aldolase/adducin N-terminal domain-containing protein n=1 Tax=Candolleomyces aberdarensis TaxID=2316362 RepID=A0A4V1Q530_9AGAR|nr:hypothetical protein EST38_g1743 [Candolleomyces aberdarensis]